MIADSSFSPAELCRNVLLLLLLRTHADAIEAQVRTVEAGHVHHGVAQAQAVDDVVAHPRVGGGGERDDGRVADAGADAAEVAVAGPEVVAPLGDAVRLIDGQQVHMEAAQGRRERAVAKPFRRHIEEL